MKTDIQTGAGARERVPSGLRSAHRRASAEHATREDGTLADERERPINEERAQLRDTLHRRGMRMTPQRQLVLDALLELEHATPEQVCQHVQRSTPTVNITTIYRTLELLENLGIVRHTHLGHGAPNYSVYEHQHVHLVCHRCGDVVEAPLEVMTELRGTLRARFGFALDASHLALSGHCRKCSAQENHA